MDAVRATRYPELGYCQTTKGLWRIVDRTGGDDFPAFIGPHYKTKTELLADLDRFARVYGAEK